MIFLQLLALILCIPLCAVALIVFNIYFTFWMYLAAMSVFLFICASFIGLVFLSFSVTVVVFIAALGLLYIRLQQLKKRSQQHAAADTDRKSVV